MREYVKTAWEELDYGWDFGKPLPAGDTIQTSTWIVDAGVTVIGQGNDNTTTQIFLGGGTLLDTYKCVNQVVSVGGRKLERVFTVRIVPERYA